MSLTQAQLELRKTGVGGSQCAAGCGMSPWQQTVELYLEKIGQADEKEITEAMLIGSHMEAGGVALWSALRQRPVNYPLPTARHPDLPFILATGDAEIGDGEGLEFKNMNSYRYRNLVRDGIENVAPEYVFQAQQQMMVYGWRKVTLAVLVDMKLYDHVIEANERLQRIIVERLRVFWDYVERREPPPIDFSREGALRAVQALYPEVKTGAVVRLDEETSVMWEAYEKAGREARDLEKSREGYKAAVLAKIGENYAGLLADGSRMIRRKVIERKGYTVEPGEYLDVRAVKFDGSPITELPALLPESSDVDDGEPSDHDDLVRRIDFKLQSAGFLLVDTSPSGSRYYLHRTEPTRVRVADHEPNDKTATWMDRAGCDSIRIDEPDALERTAEILEQLEPAAV